MLLSPTVSGIIIFLNGEKFLAEAIESVLAQTFDDWELLLVDDGSTDGSTAIAKQYAQRFPERIRYIDHPGHANLGMSAARNAGLRQARGEFIAFVDADDVWMSDKLRDQVALMRRHPEVAMLYGRTQIWHGWTGQPADAARDYITHFEQRDETVEGIALLASFLDSERHLPCTCSVLIRREAALKAGGFEDAFRSAYEDMAFYAKLFLQAKVFIASGCWDRYRQHPDSSCAVAIRQGEHHPSQPNRARRAYLYFVEKHLTAQGCRDPRVWAVLRRELWPYRHPVLLRIMGLGRGIIRRALRLARLLVGSRRPASQQAQTVAGIGAWIYGAAASAPGWLLI